LRSLPPRYHLLFCFMMMTCIFPVCICFRNQKKVFSFARLINVLSWCFEVINGFKNWFERSLDVCSVFKPVILNSCRRNFELKVPLLMEAMVLMRNLSN
jgi:hypothetical protein